MKSRKYSFFILLLCVVFTCVFSFAACEDDVKIYKLGEEASSKKMTVVIEKIINKRIIGNSMVNNKGALNFIIILAEIKNNTSKNIKTGTPSLEGDSEKYSAYWASAWSYDVDYEKGYNSVKYSQKIEGGKSDKFAFIFKTIKKHTETEFIFTIGTSGNKISISLTGDEPSN
jgi:hypothetical protein